MAVGRPPDPRRDDHGPHGRPDRPPSSRSRPCSPWRAARPAPACGSPAGSCSGATRQRKEDDHDGIGARAGAGDHDGGRTSGRDRRPAPPGPAAAGRAAGQGGALLPLEEQRHAGALAQRGERPRPARAPRRRPALPGRAGPPRLQPRPGARWSGAPRGRPLLRARPGEWPARPRPRPLPARPGRRHDQELPPADRGGVPRLDPPRRGAARACGGVRAGAVRGPDDAQARDLGRGRHGTRTALRRRATRARVAARPCGHGRDPGRGETSPGRRRGPALGPLPGLADRRHQPASAGSPWVARCSRRSRRTGGGPGRPTPRPGCCAAVTGDGRASCCGGRRASDSSARASPSPSSVATARARPPRRRAWPTGWAPRSWSSARTSATHGPPRSPSASRARCTWPGRPACCRAPGAPWTPGRRRRTTSRVRPGRCGTCSPRATGCGSTTRCAASPTPAASSSATGGRCPSCTSWTARAWAGSSTAQGHGSRVVRRLAEAERRIYAHIGLPDVLVVLRLDPEVAVSRRPEDEPGYVRTRNAEVFETDWSTTPAVVLDATLPAGARARRHPHRHLGEALNVRPSSPPVVVELAGLPGSGKTTLAAHTHAALVARGMPCSIADAGISAAAATPARAARRAAWAGLEVARHPRRGVAAVRGVRATGPASVRDGVAGTVQWLAVQRLVARSRHGWGVQLMEEGPLQTLWTLGLRSREDVLSGPLPDARRRGPYRPPRRRRRPGRAVGRSARRPALGPQPHPAAPRAGPPGRARARSRAALRAGRRLGSRPRRRPQRRGAERVGPRSSSGRVGAPGRLGVRG